MGSNEALDIGGYSDAATFILVSLKRGPKHGVGISEDIRNFSEYRISPATLYVALSRLVELGLVEKLPQEDRKKPYRITPKGETALDTKLALYRKVERAARAETAIATVAGMG